MQFLLVEMMWPNRFGTAPPIVAVEASNRNSSTSSSVLGIYGFGNAEFVSEKAADFVFVRDESDGATG